VSGNVVVSQLGARMHYAVPRILHQAGRLERLYTDICAVKGWPRALGTVPIALPSALRRLRGRLPDGIPPELIHCFEGIGLAAALGRMLDRSQTADIRVGLRVARRFSSAVVRSGFGSAKGFYGISGECLEQIRAARARGLWTVVEQINAPRQVIDRLVATEVKRHPGWETPLEYSPVTEELAAREKAEWNSADLVVCPSEFVRDGIAAVGGPVERCVIVPYGVDSRFALPPREKRNHGPLRVLTVGAVGLRKGSPYIFEAARHLRGLAEFRLVGPVGVPPEVQGKLGENVELTGMVPRHEIVAHYAWADVFLLPSVCEGSATVIYEALAASLPVVTTPNAGSVVRDGIDGYICPPADTVSLCEKLELLARDADALRTMSRQAASRAEDYGLAGYGLRLIDALDLASARASRESRKVA